MADTTIEDLIVRRLTHRGMTTEGYQAFLKNTTISEDTKQKIQNNLKNTTTSADAGIPKAGVSHLLNSLHKMQTTPVPGKNIPFSLLPIEEWASIKNVKYLIDNRLISGAMYKGYMDAIINDAIQVKPISRLITTNKEYGKQIGGGGERVTPVSVPDDIYATKNAFIKEYPKGSIDRITARLVWMTGDRGGEMGRLTLNSFNDPENPTYKTSLTGTKLLKQAKFKGQLSYFTGAEAYYILRARQMAIASGQALDAPLFPNLERINKNIGTYLKNTYSDADSGAFTEYTEKEGKYRDLKPRRVFARNLFKDRVGSLFAISKLAPGSDNFQIAQNAITNTEITTGIRGPVSNIKYMIADGSLRLIIDPAMNVMDDSYAAYSGYNSIQSMLADDGVINEVRSSNGAIIHDPIEVKSNHIKLIPAEHAPLRHSYAMGWMAPEAMTQWEEIHSKSFRSNLKDHTARITQLDFQNEAFINDSVSKAVLSTQERLLKSAEANNKFIQETNDYNKFLEEEKIKRQSDRAYDKKVDKNILDKRTGESKRAPEIDSKELENEQTQDSDTKPVRKEGESPRDFNKRLKEWRSAAMGIASRIANKGLMVAPILEPFRYKAKAGQRVEEQLAQFAIFPSEVPEDYYTGQRAKELESKEEVDLMIRTNLMMEPASMEENVAELRQREGSFLSEQDREILDNRELIYLDEQKPEIF